MTSNPVNNAVINMLLSINNSMNINSLDSFKQICLTKDSQSMNDIEGSDVPTDATKESNTEASEKPERKKSRAPKEKRKHYMLTNCSMAILKNTLIKKIFDKINEEGTCKMEILVKLYEKEKETLRRTDGSYYKGNAKSTVRGALEANRFFGMCKKSRTDKSQRWAIINKKAADVFFKEQILSIKMHKKKYKLPIKKPKVAKRPKKEEPPAPTAPIC